MVKVTVSQIFAAFTVIALALQWLIFLLAGVPDYQSLTWFDASYFIARELFLFELYTAFAGGLAWVIWRAGLRVFAGVFLILALLPALAFIGASWLSFFYLERFIDISALQLFKAAPWQIFVHAQSIFALSPALLGVFFLALLFALLVLAYTLAKFLPKPLLLSLLVFVVVFFAITNVAKSSPQAMREVSVKTSTGLVAYQPFFRKTAASFAGPLNALFESKMRSKKFAATAISPDLLLARASADNYFKGVEVAPSKNVVVILIESFRYDVFDKLEAHFGKEIMPNMKKLMQKSHVYRNTFAQATSSNFTDPVPFSSQYPLRELDMHFYPKNPAYDATKIYDILAGFGYKTAIVSSQNETWMNMYNFLRSENLDLYAHAGNIREMAGFMAGNEKEYFSALDKKEGAFTNQDKIKDSVTLYLASQWVDSVASEGPFFLYMNLQNTHLPFFIEDQSDLQFVDGKKSLDEYYQHAHKSEARLDYSMQVYAEALHDMDKSIAKFIEHLKAKGLWDDTVFLLSGDTGVLFNQKGIGNAGPIFEQVLRLPLFVHGQEIAAKVDDRLVQQVDIMPTILGFLGLPAWPGSQGIDMSKADACNQYGFFIAHAPGYQQYSVTNGQALLIYDYQDQSYQARPLEAYLPEGVTLEYNQKAMQKAQQQLIQWMQNQLSFYQSSALQSQFFAPKIAANEACKLN